MSVFEDDDALREHLMKLDGALIALTARVAELERVIAEASKEERYP